MNYVQQFLFMGCFATAACGQSGEVIRVGSVVVDAGRREVISTGFVNQVEGYIELLACGPGGKTHESVFVMQASPVDLQAGLLLLGLKPGTPPKAQGEGQPSGSRVDIQMAWVDQGSNCMAAAESFLRDLETGATLTNSGWIFTGSVFEDGKFKALSEESMVATFWDPWAVINIASVHGSNDERLVVNRKMVPTNGCPVTFHIRAE